MAVAVENWVAMVYDVRRPVRPSARRSRAYTAVEGFEGFLEGMELIRADSGGEGPWAARVQRGRMHSGRSRRKAAIAADSSAVRLSTWEPWGRAACLVLGSADGERQLVADVGARDKRTEHGGTADAADAGRYEVDAPVLLSGASSGVVRAEGVYRELGGCRVRLWRGFDRRVRLYSGDSNELSGRCS